MSNQSGILQNFNQLIVPDDEWDDEPSNMAVEVRRPERLIDANESEDHMSVVISDRVIDVPIKLLMKFELFRDLSDFTAGDEKGLLRLPIVTARVMEIFIAWNSGVLDIAAIPWSDFEAVVRSCDFLQFDEFFRAMGKNVITPRVKGLWYEVRQRLLFNFENCQADDNNWSYDPVRLLNSDNFVLDLFPQHIITEIYFELEISRRYDFVLAFGESSHRAHLNSLNRQ